MNAEDRRKLRPVVNHIMTDENNIRLQLLFACIYDDTQEINEPYVRLSMSDYRVLCNLCGISDMLTVQHLPHYKNATEQYVKEKESKENVN